MSGNIDKVVKSDQNRLFSHLKRDSTFSVEEILAFARELDENYAEQKESIRRLQFNGHVGLPADEMAMALLPEELPLQPEEHLMAVKTTGNGDCLYNAMSLAMDGTESNASLLRLLVALELLLNVDYYIHHPRLTSFSNTDSHHPDTLFSLCLTTDSDQVFQDKSRSREEAIWSEARVASKSYEWSGFFHVAALSSVLCRPIFSAYPHCNTWIRDFLHCEIGPRNPTLLSSKPLFLLWSREGNLDNRAGAWFSPNHFVPLYRTVEKKQICQPEPDLEDSIQGNVGNLKSGKSSCKKGTTKKSSKPSEQSGTSNAMSKKRGRLEDFGFQRGLSEPKRPKVEEPKLYSKCTNETPTGLLLNWPNLQKQASKEKPSVMRKFNPKWKEEFPWLLFNAEENVMICDLCSANPSVAGNSDFLKGCSNFKKETVRKHAISNGHIRAREMSHSKEKSIAESQIAQSFSKINKDMQSQERKEMEAKINTAYFVAKEELPFSKFEGLLSLQRKNGVTLNNTYANKTSCAELVSFLSDGFRDDLICEVNSKNYFSLMADGSADFGGTENETVVCRLVRDGAPVNCILGHKAVAHAHAEGKFIIKTLINKVTAGTIENIPYI